MLLKYLPYNDTKCYTKKNPGSIYVYILHIYIIYNALYCH